MDPMTWLLIASAVSGAVGSAKQSQAQGEQTALGAGQFEEQRRDKSSELMSQFLQSQLGMRNQQALQGLQSTQMDPYAQAKALNNAQIKNQFAHGWTPGQGFSGPLWTPAFSSSNLASEKNKFDNYVAASSPNVPTGNPNAEEFRMGYNKQNEDLTTMLQNYLRHIGYTSGTSGYSGF